MNVNHTPVDEIIETATGAAPSIIDELLESFDVGDANSREEVLGMDTAPDATELDLEVAVAAIEETTVTADKPAKKGKKGKKATDADPDKPSTEPGEEPAAAAAAPKKERKFFSKQSDRIAHNLGDKLGENMLLVLSDAALTGDDLIARNKEILETIDGTAKKVGEKAAMLFKWLQTGGDLNEVMKRAFKLLKKDGFITSGDKGTMQLDLLKKPYSLGTARSQSNQIFVLFRLLKIANEDGKGKLVPNPESLILAKANALLGL